MTTDPRSPASPDATITTDSTLAAILHQLENGEAAQGDVADVRWCAGELRAYILEHVGASPDARPSTKPFGYAVLDNEGDSADAVIWLFPETAEGEAEHFNGDDNRAHLQPYTTAPLYLVPQPDARRTREGALEGAWSDERLTSASPDELMELCEQLQVRAFRYQRKAQHDEWRRVRSEVIRRMSVSSPARTPKAG